jgi:predicted dehydrogenase
MKPLTRPRFHYDWHWQWDTGNGDLGNQGIHQMDIARWFLGEMELSPGVLSFGGRFGYEDDGETANTQIVYHDYAAAPLLFGVLIDWYGPGVLIFSSILSAAALAGLCMLRIVGPTAD